MGANFNLKTLTVALAALSAASIASAAGLDRSGQDITAFLQDGTYAETVYTYIDADVSGKDSSGNKIDDIAEDYDFFRYGVKTDINDTLVLVFYMTSHSVLLLTTKVITTLLRMIVAIYPLEQVRLLLKG